MSDFVLYAPNTHTGGGLLLLQNLLSAWPEDRTLCCYLDERAQELLDVPFYFDVTWVRPSLTSRLTAEWNLSRRSRRNATVLHMNSLPPIFSSRGKVIVFLQNRNFIEQIKYGEFSRRQALRIMLERIWCRIFRGKVDEYIVQTNSFKDTLSVWYQGNSSDDLQIRVLPFVDLSDMGVRTPETEISKKYDFIYVADSLAQKNHKKLLDCWEILLGTNTYPSLALTLRDNDRALIERINELNSRGAHITNIGWISRSDLINVYNESRALIYPSLRESFGLPLLEASHLGLPVLASERDYVYDVCVPSQTFDPLVPDSIARAVRRFLGMNPPTLAVLSPKKFIEEVVKE